MFYSADDISMVLSSFRTGIAPSHLPHEGLCQAICEAESSVLVYATKPVRGITQQYRAHALAVDCSGVAPKTASLIMYPPVGLHEHYIDSIIFERIGEEKYKYFL